MVWKENTWLHLNTCIGFNSNSNLSAFKIFAKNSTKMKLLSLKQFEKDTIEQKQLKSISGRVDCATTALTKVVDTDTSQQQMLQFSANTNSDGGRALYHRSTEVFTSTDNMSTRIKNHLKWSELIFRAISVFLFSLLYVNNSFTQQVLTVKPIDRKEYYKCILKAENWIMHEEFKNANKEFKNAFKLAPGFTRDYYNACISAALVENKAKFINYIDTLLARNIIIPKVMDTFLRSDLVSENIRKITINKLKNYKAQDYPYDSFYIELQHKDQNIRKYCGYSYNFPCADTIKIVDSTNFVVLLNYFAKTGMPNDFTKRHKQVITDNLSNNLVILHNTMWSRFWADSIILDGFNSGYIDRRAFISLFDRWANENPNVDYGSLPVLIINNKLYFDSPGKGAIEQWNTNRKGIKECDYVSQILRMFYQYYHPHFIFYSYCYFPTFELDETTTNELLKILKYAPKNLTLEQLNSMYR